jgi:hypothetical protein
MPSVLIQVADEVVTTLNSALPGTFSQTFEAERSYADWELPLEDSAPQDRVLVDVTPVPPLESELETRGSIAYRPAVDIIVRRRITPSQRDANGKLLLAEIDALVLFVEELAEFFTTDQLATSTARWAETEIRRAFVPTHLREKHQFTGIIRVTFDLEQAL